MKVSVFVDGFNLYNRALKTPRAADGSTYKWLDLEKLAESVLNDPTCTIESVRYFTARVHALPHDPDAPARQGQYLRALRTLPRVTLHYGLFKRRKGWQEPVTAIATPDQKGLRTNPDGSQCVFVYKFSEKGSDVNLASHLILDGARVGAYDAAVVMTNDSDQVEPIRLVRDVLGKPVHVFDPCLDRPAAELQRAATSYRKIDLAAIAASQFPNPLTDARGQFSKPVGW